MLIYEIVCRQYPYEEIDSAIEVIQAIVVNQLLPAIPDDVHPTLREVMLGLWDRDPLTRLTIEEVVQKLTIQFNFSSRRSVDTMSLDNSISRSDQRLSGRFSTNSIEHTSAAPSAGPAEYIGFQVEMVNGLSDVGKTSSSSMAPAQYVGFEMS